MTDDETRRAAANDASTTDRTGTGARSPTGARGTASTPRTAGAGGRPADAGGPIGGSEGDTSSAQARFWLTNDVLAFLLVISFVGVVVGAALGALDLAAVPVEMRLAYLTVSGGAAVWTFGQPAYRTWARARRGGRRAAGACACCSMGGSWAVGARCHRPRGFAGRSAPTACARGRVRRPRRRSGRRRCYRTRF